MTIQELMEKRAKLWDEARTFLDSKRNDSGVLSEEDSKTYDAMEKQILFTILVFPILYNNIYYTIKKVIE